MKERKKDASLSVLLKKELRKITLMIIAMMVVGILASIVLSTFINGMYQGPYKEQVLIGKLKFQFETLHRGIYNGIAEDEPKYIVPLTDTYHVLLEEMEKEVAELKAISGDQRAKEIEAFEETLAKLKPLTVQIKDHLNAFAADNSNEYVLALEVMRAEGKDLINESLELLNEIETNAGKDAENYLRASRISQFCVFAVLILVLLLNLFVSVRTRKVLLKEITVPVDELVEASTALAAGDLNTEIRYREENELGVLADSMRGMILTLRRLIEELDGLTRAVAEGQLSVRADAEGFEGGYREIVTGINHTIDGLVNPLNNAANYIRRISRGDIPEIITEKAPGDLADIADSLNICIEAINRLIGDTEELVGAAVHGRLNQRADSSRHGGDFAAIIDGVNRTIDTLVGHIGELPSPVVAFDRDMKINYANKAAAAMAGMPAEQLEGAVCKDIFAMETCASENSDAVRALFRGETVKKDTKAVIGKRTYEISYAGLPLTDETGTVVGGLQILVDQTQVRRAAEEAERREQIARKQSAYQEAAVERLVGNLGQLAKGDLNMEITVAPVDEDTAAIGENFEKINRYLSGSVEAIRKLIRDAETMTEAALQGDLKHRADAAEHGGSFREIIDGMNRTLDAITEPIGNAVRVLKSLEEGDLHAEMDGNYRGDYGEIKNAMNSTVRNLRVYIDEIAHVLAEIGNKNLDVSPKADYKGAFIQIRDSLGSISESLSQVMGDIGVASEQVAAGSRQVSEGSQALSQGSTEQASAIQELTASITEISGQTKQNAVNAGKASQLAEEARENAEKGNGQMQEMLASMDAINESSSNISKIIKVIDDIAFQTNILALNAAVEAARAGQHGKGFAVVAEEVRNLAARSAAAARETTELIEGSIQKVDAGTRLAGETAEALAGIVESIEKSARLVAGIAEASNEQATGISQINKGIEQVSQVVQNNSATAEESAAASEELSSQAEMLKEMVSEFRISGKQAVQKALPSAPGAGKTPEDLSLTGSGPRIVLDDGEFDKY